MPTASSNKDISNLSPWKIDARIRRTGKRVIQIMLNDLNIKSVTWEKAKLTNKKGIWQILDEFVPIIYCRSQRSADAMIRVAGQKEWNPKASKGKIDNGDHSYAFIEC